MNKLSKIIIAITLFLLGVIAVGMYKFNFTGSDIHVPKSGALSPKDATYRIDGQFVNLKNGLSEIAAAPSSASKIITRYFGNEVRHDFNGDGREDVAFLLTQQTGGSGTFYYVVAALNTPEGYVGSQGLFLGDRIAPQTTEMGKGNIIVVNYADRKSSESFAVQPSVGKSIWLLLDPKTMQFGEVAQNFEGEADPSRMTLGMKTWNWVSTTYNNGTQVVPRDEKKFAITFKKDGTFSSVTDCNSVSGNYTVRGNSIILDRMISTLMYCEGWQEADYVKMLGDAQNVHFTSRGELIFDLKMNSGSMVFR